MISSSAPGERAEKGVRRGTNETAGGAVYFYWYKMKIDLALEWIRSREGDGASKEEPDQDHLVV